MCLRYMQISSHALSIHANWRLWGGEGCVPTANPLFVSGWLNICSACHNPFEIQMHKLWSAFWNLRTVYKYEAHKALSLSVQEILPHKALPWGCPTIFAHRSILSLIAPWLVAFHDCWHRPTSAFPHNYAHRDFLPILCTFSSSEFAINVIALASLPCPGTHWDYSFSEELA